MWDKIYRKLQFLTYLWFKSVVYFRNRYNYDGIKLRTDKNVFHPGLLYSTKNLYNFLKDINLANSNLLELGAGTGLIALDCARRGAIVTATDINPFAIDVLKTNSKVNEIEINIIESNLFDKIPSQIFNHIIINPPYYKADPQTKIQKAFFAGSNFEYFIKLFNQLSNFVDNKSIVYMILASNCDIKSIKEIANVEGFKFILKKTIKHKSEENFIFQINQINPTKL